jgi:tetratricopeptide (TPR) repeat protein
MAHYWIATVHRSPEAGLTVLQEVVKRFPSSLLARTFLADHLFAMRRFEEALVVAKALVASVPGSSIARARVSTILARLGRDDEALRVAEESAKAAPKDPRALTTLANRYLDVGRYADALATLEPLKQDARVLNLRGWAYLRLNKLDEAQRAFAAGHAATDATPLDWRTRGRLIAGLMRVAAARGDTAATKRLVDEAQRDGFVAFLRGLADSTVDAALDRAHANDAPPTAATGIKGPRFIRPKEALPFSLDPSGQIDPQGRARVTPPSQLELMRF